MLFKAPEIVIELGLIGVTVDTITLDVTTMAKRLKYVLAEIAFIHSPFDSSPKSPNNNNNSNNNKNNNNNNNNNNIFGAFYEVSMLLQ